MRVFRDRDPHELVDYNVSVALSGGQEAAHLTGDNAAVLPTDTQKNTVYALAAEDDVVAQPESYGIRLARHFVDTTEPVTWAGSSWRCTRGRGWDSPHAFARDSHVRTATVTYDGSATRVVSGVRDLVLLKTTDSEFWGYLTDRFTTLEPTRDMATSLVAQWLHTSEAVDWGRSHDTVLAALTGVFAGHHSLALQHTLYEMGSAALAGQPEIAEIRFSAPTSTTFSTTWAASAWPTRTRSSTPTTGPTGSSRPPSAATTPSTRPVPSTRGRSGECARARGRPSADKGLVPAFGRRPDSDRQVRR